MTTVKLKFRKSTVPGRPGMLFYQLCQGKVCKRINSGVKIMPHVWRAVSEDIALRECIREEYKVNMPVLLEVEKGLRMLKRIILRYERDGGKCSVEEVAHLFSMRKIPGEGGRTGGSVKRSCVLGYMSWEIERLKEEMRIGTAQCRRRTMLSFSNFLQGVDLPFEELTDAVVSDYLSWLRRRCVKRNTISFYMRGLRSVYNKAVAEGLVKQNYPFRDVFTGVDLTRKRAVPEEVLQRLKNLDLSWSGPLALARDMFLFSYCTMGMAFVDMAFLRRQDVKQMRITYMRRKTGQNMCVRVEPFVQRIILKYSARDSEYVFPVLKSKEYGEAYREYSTALRYYNRQLRRLSLMLELEMPLSSYTSRHSWATAARNRNTPVSVISSGMGHTSEKTTRIYLAAIEDDVVDRANGRVVAALNGCEKSTTSRKIV